MKVWEPYMSWSDCILLTRMMNKVQEQIATSLSDGKNDQGILNDDSSLRVSIIDLQKTIERIRAKDDKTK